MKTMTKGLIFNLLALLMYSSAALADNSIEAILNSINALEKKSEPKCYATASRLEYFMFGSPLDTEARFVKNMLQKEFIEHIWAAATSYAIVDDE